MHPFVNIEKRTLSTEYLVNKMVRLLEEEWFNQLTLRKEILKIV